ncbi:MAG TPA: choice-of-anchor D domain-containing protein [Terriglobales bacterium]|nr:choice-of-anchor D domain-containing protein [Terriglobales bacterium]
MISPFVPSRKAWTVLAQLVLSAVAACAGTLDLPTVEISTANLAFGNQVVESRSQPQKILLLNRGTAPLTLKKVAASGDFAVESDCATTLDAGHGCTIVTTFSPSLVGDADGKITIEDDSKSSPHVVTLSGTGVLPLTITPAMLRFPPRTVGTSDSALLTVTNNQAENITGLRITPGGDFTQSSSCVTGIPAGKSCDVRITFTPHDAKQVREKITFLYSGKMQMVMASGTGVAAAPTVSTLRNASPQIPAVTALAPVIPPAPNLNAMRTARSVTPAPAPVAVIPPAPAVSSVKMASARPSVASTQVIPPAPVVDRALPITLHAARPGTAPDVISPPPKIAGSLGSAPRVMRSTPAVIAPAPNTKSLRQNARVVSTNPEVTVRTFVVETPKPPATQVASMNPPAETTAVRAIAEGSAPTATAPAMPVATSAPPMAQPSAPAVIVASVPPAVTRSTPSGPKVTLMVGLKGTAVGTVTSANGSINCGAKCQDNFVAGQKVVLTPQITSNASFAGWRGCDSVAGTNCIIVMDRDKSVTAIFVRHYDDLSPE